MANRYETGGSVNVPEPEIKGKPVVKPGATLLPIRYAVTSPRHFSMFGRFGQPCDEVRKRVTRRV